MPSLIKVGARASPLSIAQVDEVLREIRVHHPQISFLPHFLKTRGDIDRNTSLRYQPKNDFFTKEVDDLLLSGVVDVAIHSAKDLPEQLPVGLKIVAITRGVDSRDALVMRRGLKLSEVKRVATSSIRRQEVVKELLGEVEVVDLRGTIGERLDRLEIDVDGVVVAESALIRLGLTELNRVILPGETAPLQGQLAIVARSDDLEMQRLFSQIGVCV